MRHAIAALLVLSGFAGGRAEAQATWPEPCSSVVAPHYEVSAVEVGENRYDYVVLLRSQRPWPVTTDVSFLRFPDWMNVTQPIRPGVTIAPFGSARLRVGTGQSPQVTTSMFLLAFDGGMTGPNTIRVANCRGG